MANNYSYPYNPINTAPLNSPQMGQYFPQPAGSVFMINNSMELANIPANTGLTAVLCPNESLMYLKSIQNGQPAVISYSLVPQQSAQSSYSAPDLEERFKSLERQIAELKKLWEGD